MTPRRSIRGIRQGIPSGFVIGRGAGARGAPGLVGMTALGNQIAAAAGVPSTTTGAVLGGGIGAPLDDIIAAGAWSSGTAYVVGNVVRYLAAFYICFADVGPTGTAPLADGTHWTQISLVDSLDLDDAFGSTEGQILQRGASAWQVLAPGTADQVLASGGGAALNSWAGLSALLDAVFGGTQGDILYRGASSWTVLAPGTSGNFLKTLGASANPAWAALTVPTFNAAGAWSGATAYNPFDVVTYNGSAYLNYATIAAPTGGTPPTVDGTASATAGGSPTSATTSALTTTGAGYVGVFVWNERGSSPQESVSTIVGGGLTFTLQGKYAQGSGNFDALEFWTAPSAGAIASQTFVVTMTGAVDALLIAVFGAKGTTSPDPNASLPAFGAGVSETISTTNPDNMILFASASDQGVSSAQSTPPGFTDILEIHESAGAHASQMRVSYLRVTSAQTGLSIGTVSGVGAKIFASALSNIGTLNTSPDLDNAHWV